jgi:hypothetical protein
MASKAEGDVGCGIHECVEWHENQMLCVGLFLVLYSGFVIHSSAFTVHPLRLALEWNRVVVDRGGLAHRGRRRHTTN